MIFISLNFAIYFYMFYRVTDKQNKHDIKLKYVYKCDWQKLYLESIHTVFFVSLTHFNVKMNTQFGCRKFDCEFSGLNWCSIFQLDYWQSQYILYTYDLYISQICIHIHFVSFLLLLRSVLVFVSVYSYDNARLKMYIILMKNKPQIYAIKYVCDCVYKYVSWISLPALLASHPLSLSRIFIHKRSEMSLDAHVDLI